MRDLVDGHDSGVVYGGEGFALSSSIDSLDGLFVFWQCVDECREGCHFSVYRDHDNHLPEHPQVLPSSCGFSKEVFSISYLLGFRVSCSACVVVAARWHP